MKIQNKTVANLSVGSVKTRGKTAKTYMVVPGEATLELDDTVWLEEFAEPCEHLVAAGNLVIIEAPALTKEQEEALEAEELAKAEALIAKKKAKASK